MMPVSTTTPALPSGTQLLETAGLAPSLKILLVLTDGYPCHSGGYGKGAGFLGGLLTGAIADCKRAGIRVGAVGIGTDFVKNYYDPWVAVHRMADLASASTRLLGSMLKGAVRR